MITVSNLNEAWEIANQFIDSDYYDAEASERAGYEIFRSEKEYYDYVCNLGDRLEVNLKESNRTINIWVDSKNGSNNNILSQLSKSIDDASKNCDVLAEEMETLRINTIEKIKNSGDLMPVCNLYQLAKNFADECERLNEEREKATHTWGTLTEAYGLLSEALKDVDG